MKSGWGWGWGYVKHLMQVSHAYQNSLWTGAYLQLALTRKTGKEVEELRICVKERDSGNSIWMKTGGGGKGIKMCHLR